MQELKYLVVRLNSLQYQLERLYEKTESLEMTLRLDTLSNRLNQLFDQIQQHKDTVRRKQPQGFWDHCVTDTKGVLPRIERALSTLEENIQHFQPILSFAYK